MIALKLVQGIITDRSIEGIKYRVEIYTVNSTIDYVICIFKGYRHTIACWLSKSFLKSAFRSEIKIFGYNIKDICYFNKVIII